MSCGNISPSNIDSCKELVIKAVYYIDKKDVKFINGKMVIKRKYGKHKRKIIKEVL